MLAGWPARGGSAGSRRRKGDDQDDPALRAAKVRQYEAFLESRLKPDLADAERRRGLRAAELKAWDELRDNLQALMDLKQTPTRPLQGDDASSSAAAASTSTSPAATTASTTAATPATGFKAHAPVCSAATAHNSAASAPSASAGFKARVPLGSGVYCQAAVPSADEVCVEVGLGFYVQAPLHDALRVVDLRRGHAQARLDKADDEVVELRAHTRLVEEGLRELLYPSPELEIVGVDS